MSKNNFFYVILSNIIKWQKICLITDKIL